MSTTHQLVTHSWESFPTGAWKWNIQNRRKTFLLFQSFDKTYYWITKNSSSCSIYITCEDFGTLLWDNIMEAQVTHFLKPVFVDVIFAFLPSSAPFPHCLGSCICNTMLIRPVPKCFWASLALTQSSKRLSWGWQNKSYKREELYSVSKGKNDIANKMDSKLQLVNWKQSMRI